jgi:hypothetical protein
MVKPIVSDSFPFIGSDKLERLLDIRKTQRQELQQRLPRPLYWYQFPGGRKIFWNLVLLQDYLINGDRVVIRNLTQCLKCHPRLSLDLQCAVYQVVRVNDDGTVSLTSDYGVARYPGDWVGVLP